MGAEDVDLLVCNGCGRSFTSSDGPAMLEALKGPCPDCGGQFELRGHITVEEAMHYDRAHDEAESSGKG